MRDLEGELNGGEDLDLSDDLGEEELAEPFDDELTDEELDLELDEDLAALDGEDVSFEDDERLY
jgi:hypothetical protein